MDKNEEHSRLISGAVVKLHSGQILLSDAYCQEQIELIKKHLNIDPELWAMMFKPFVEHFAEYVQAFPDARSHNRPILFVALTRCATAMASIPNYASDRYRFAMFSASLLLNLGIMHTDFRITVVSEQGDYIDEWSPMSGASRFSAFWRPAFRRGWRCRIRRRRGSCSPAG